MASDAGTLWTNDCPDGLQESAKIAGSKAITPAATAMTIGTSPLTRASAGAEAETETDADQRDQRMAVRGDRFADDGLGVQREADP
jgi:hypothetical protein